ncbi:MAG: metal-dependent transcriptional regulator [Treponema sp.]|nr:metal-dependent transcriptional regulator [Treponema sp.]
MSVLSDIAAEDYLKAIVKALAELDKTELTTGEVAALLSVTPGTATAMLKKLEKDGYVRYKKYHGCTLTEKGTRYGIAVVRRHRLLEKFLSSLFNMTDEEIHADAEHMEHAVSQKLIDCIDEYLGYPERNQTGSLIPRKNQKRLVTDMPLAKIPPKTFFKIIRLPDKAEQKKYCIELGLVEGTCVQLCEKQPTVGIAVLKTKKAANIRCPLVLLDTIFVERSE